MIEIQPIGSNTSGFITSQKIEYNKLGKIQGRIVTCLQKKYKHASDKVYTKILLIASETIGWLDYFARDSTIHRNLVQNHM